MGKKKQEEIESPSAFEDIDESSMTQLYCGDSIHNVVSPHLQVPATGPYGEINTFSHGKPQNQAQSTMSTSAFGDQDSENLVSKFKEINISPTSAH